MAKQKRGCRYFLRLSAFVVVAFILTFYFGVVPLSGTSEAYAMVHPVHNHPCCGTPADAGYIMLMP